MKLELFSDDNLLYASYDDVHNALSIDLVEQVNTTNTLNFTLPYNNPNIDNVTKLSSVIELYEDDTLVFEGRVLYTEDDIIKNRTFSCEGSLAFLIDSIQRPKEYHDITIREYLEDKIYNHNKQVEESKRFTVGRVTVANSTDNAYRIDNDYPTTLENINDKLVSRLGGYLVVRKDKGIRYLDYIETYGVESKQVIEFKKNILDLTNHISAENIITALIPLGAKDDTTELPLTIESINNGLDYVYDESAVKLFGWIYGKVEYDDITLPENLKRRGEEELKANIKASLSIEVTAFDLSLVHVDTDKIRLGDSVKVISKPHSIDDFFIVKKREKNYLKPSDSKIVLDTVIAKNTDKVSANNKTISSVIKPDGSVMAEKVAGFINGALAQFKLQNTIAQKQDVRAILFEDIDPNSNMFGAMSLGTQGFQIANRRNSVDNDWDWSTAVNANGIIANMIVAGTISDRTGKSFWNLEDGTLQLSGEFMQYAYNGYPSMKMTNNELKFYSWTDQGNYVGSIGATTDKNSGRVGVALWADQGDVLNIGARVPNNENLVSAIYVDANTITTEPPLIAHTASGTMFSNNPGGGVRVKNGLIVGYSMQGATGSVSFGGRNLEFRDGLLIGTS